MFLFVCLCCFFPCIESFWVGLFWLFLTDLVVLECFFIARLLFRLLFPFNLYVSFLPFVLQFYPDFCSWFDFVLCFLKPFQTSLVMMISIVSFSSGLLCNLSSFTHPERGVPDSNISFHVLGSFILYVLACFFPFQSISVCYCPLNCSRFGCFFFVTVSDNHLLLFLFSPSRFAASSLSSCWFSLHLSMFGCR